MYSFRFWFKLHWKFYWKKKRRGFLIIAEFIFYKFTLFKKTKKKTKWVWTQRGKKATTNSWCKIYSIKSIPLASPVPILLHHLYNRVPKRPNIICSLPFPYNQAILQAIITYHFLALKLQEAIQNFLPNFGFSAKKKGTQYHSPFLSAYKTPYNTLWYHHYQPPLIANLSNQSPEA